jgi:Zn-dependent protease with chaperone function
VGFEPSIEKAIDEQKRAIRGQKVTYLYLFASIFFLVLVCVGMMIGLLFTNLWPAALLFLLPIAIVAVQYAILYRRFRREFSSVTRHVEQYDEATFNRFRMALDGVCIGAGIDKLPLAALEVATPNAFPVRLDDVPTVAVTGELLGVDLDRGEIEAIMAHEVAHIVFDDMVSPSFFNIFQSTIIVGTADPGFWPAGYATSLLADSIAAKLTGRPGSLKSAIIKLAEKIEEAGLAPAEEFVLPKRLFIWPLGYWFDWKPGSVEDVSDFSAAPTAETDRSLKEAQDGHHLAEETFTYHVPNIMESRIQNLELIERGTWHSFGEDGQNSRIAVQKSRLLRLRSS